MPILDPSIQLALCLNNMETVVDNNFFLYYLHYASDNISRSLDSILSYFQFQKDIKESKHLLNDFFKCKINIDLEFNNPDIQNYYEYLLSKIPKENHQKFSEMLKGQYYVYENNKQTGETIIKSNFFRPVLTKSNIHAWYFTDSPIAILCINLLEIKKFSLYMKNSTLNEFLEFELIELEIDLLAASGFVLVLSIITNPIEINTQDLKNQFDIDFSKKGDEKDNNMLIHEHFIKNTILNHNFSEVHLNLTSISKNEPKKTLNFLSKKTDDDKYETHDKILRAITQNIPQFKKMNGHFYIYAPFFEDPKSDSSIYLKVIKQMPRFHIFRFSDDIREALNLGRLIGSKNNEFKCCPFSYYKNGFDQEKIRIMLCNVPIYSNENDKLNTMPSEQSYLTWAYISREDFLTWTNMRVPIVINDSSNTHCFLERFINNDDIHEIKPQFFVNDTLYLTKTDSKTLKTVNTIQDDSKNKMFNKNKKQEDVFKKEKIKKESKFFVLSKKKKLKKTLTNIIYYFQMINENIYLYKSQIFTAYEACRTFLNDDKNIKDKGFIYQVETGEGKSFIIQVIAAVLAFELDTKRPIHIASSNIRLSNRDFQQSYEFFQKLGLTSAVLLHKNELPNKEELLNKYYKKEFYGDELFDKASNMNYTVCGVGNSQNIANIVFSTFVNFESLYLRVMETCPYKVNELFQKNYLLIDEADSILIDELSNGTILSRSMKTNCENILKYVYKSYNEKKTVEHAYSRVRKRWPECLDLKITDIEDMFDDIKLVQQEEFINGKKYSIETFKEEIKEKNFILRQIDKIKDIKKRSSKKSSSKERLELNESTESFELGQSLESFEIMDSTEALMIKNAKNKSNIKFDLTDLQQQQQQQENKSIKKSNKKSNKKYKVYREVIPFDYDHKGVLEPNKEFSGFVQQFIAIKEMTNNKNFRHIKIKKVSMNYLYVSHPIFVKLYKGVCGFTGTIGNKFDKQILNNQYTLVTKKIPRNKPNRRIELPIVLCSNLQERNKKIVLEVLEFHEKGFPVLVIFQDLNEIQDVFEMLIINGIDYVNIFDGKDEKVRPDEVSGRIGAVSLGTNVCGRGTDIKNLEKALHVIVSYYTSNARVMQQAFGRTSRQGRDGTVSIICLKDQFISPIEILEMESMKNILQDFEIKNKMQQDFIDDFRKFYPWIFEPVNDTPEISDDYILTMRKSKVNVNRIKAYNYVYPICMSIQSFLWIQAQKIVSLYNCPNCIYTWQLFQRYTREMILETWSLFIDKADKKFKRLQKKNQVNGVSYKEFLDTEMEEVKPVLDIFLPRNENVQMIDAFMRIFNEVTREGELEIESSFPKKVSKYFYQTKTSIISFNVGFKIFSLVDNSGSRINIIDGVDQDRNYIIDPELLYMLKPKDGEKKPTLLSITEKIDGLFEAICSKINNIIGSYTGLKFFVRRTLSGCEFGLCFDFMLQNINDKLIDNPNRIYDIDPLLLFSIILKSAVPLLACILSIGLVYLTKIAKDITELITTSIVKITKEVVVKTIKEVLKVLAKKALKAQIEHFCDKVSKHLLKILSKNLDTLKIYHPDMEQLFKILMNILAVKEFENAEEKIQDLFTEKVCNIKISPTFFESFISNDIPVSHILKIGLLLLMCFASFMLNFQSRKNSIKYEEEEKIAAQYNDSKDIDKCNEQSNELVDTSLPPIDLKD